MAPSDFLTLAIASGLAGFAAYGVSYSYHVWRTRRARLSPPGVATGTRWPAVAIGLGLVAAGAGFGLRAVAEREGALDGRGIFTVRVPPGAEVERVAREDSIAAGAFVASFRKIALEPDAESVRRAQDFGAERRHVESVLELLESDRDRLRRDELHDRLEREDRIARLEADLGRLGGELAQARASAVLAKRKLESGGSLRQSRLMSETEYAELEKDVAWGAAEVEKLECAVAAAGRERDAAADGLRRLAAIADEQVAGLEREIAAHRARRAAVAELEDGANSRLTAGEAGRPLEVAAPFAGRVAWRDPSPRKAYGAQPLLVIAPPDAFRLRVRLPAREVDALAAAGPVVIELVDRAVERRFPGRLAESRPLAEDPDYLLAEVACDPPGEAVRDVAAGESVKARLRWAPPPATLPLVRLGATLAALGSLGALLARRRAAAPLALPAAEPVPVAEPARDAPARAGRDAVAMRAP